MRNLSLLILVFLSLFACQNVERPEKPDAFIEEEKMIDILYDISVIKSLKTYNINEMRMLDIKPESYIYDKYDIDSIQLAENISYYAVDFNEYAELWEKVRARLAAKQEEVEAEIAKGDSIQRVKSKPIPDSLKNRKIPQSEMTKGLQMNDSLVESVSG
ncbi:DUF4296 domain-containing protein [Leeuwenhoekiella sp. H156]|uniref:DUF4296 domain-containing protein n=1 Tax=Leeuwenhoekiella sp. H156 TaxID=3450128 RepID=UPI003FA4BD18